jgi:hypothetical protein
MLRVLLFVLLTATIPASAMACEIAPSAITNQFRHDALIFTGQIIDVEMYERRRSRLGWAQRDPRDLRGFPEDRGCRYGVRVVEVFHGDPERVLDVYSGFNVEFGECDWKFEIGQNAVFNLRVDDEGRAYFSGFSHHCRAVFSEEEYRVEAERRRYGWLE